LNYAGKFVADVVGSHSNFDFDSHSQRGDADTITVSDPHLLFGGDYTRSGVNLILSKNGRELVLEDYFKGEKRAALASPDGATLSGDIVNALTGHVQYAQAGGATAAATVIGHVTKLAGSATAIRNGVSIVLNMGDNVNKGDVVQSGSGSQLGITFIDGTVFALASNARMVLDEMVYDPNGTGNSSLLSLVQGTISFVAGETAKNGDMKVSTPVAILGIRGTAVLVEIGFEVPVTDPTSGTQSSIPVKFQVLQEPNGVVGSYVLYAKNDLTFSNPIATISRAGEVTSYSANGNLSVAQVTQLAPEAKAIIDAALGQYFPNYTPPPNANPQQPPSPPGSAPAEPVPQLQPQQEKAPALPTGTPTTVPINYTPPPADPASTVVQSAKIIEVTITPVNAPPTFTVTPVINVITPVVQNPVIKIPDQVTETDPDPNDVVLKYVPGSGNVVSAVGPAYTPAGLDLKSLVVLDQATGNVTYSSSSFAFLKADDKVVVTIGFDSSAGPDTVHETLTVTIIGVNDAPTITAATLTVSQGGTTVLTPGNIGVIDPDSTDMTFTVTNVTSGDKFQVLQVAGGGSDWLDATTFTTADLNAGHVRFVQGGSAIAPTFSIQANDGAALNNLSNVFTGVVNFVSVAGAILGDDGNNILVGTPGNDVFEGFGGDDLLQGAGGRDKALYADATAGITVHLAEGTVRGTADGDLASIGTDTLQSIEYIVGSNFGDTFDATGFSNTSNNAGSVPTAGRFSASITNFFEGRGGDDQIIGNGATQIAYDHASAGVTVDLAAGTGHGTAPGDIAEVGNDAFSGVTGVRGSAFDDNLSGNDNPRGVDVFYGGAGNDFIDGRAGYDLVVYAPLVDNTVTGGITVNMADGTVFGDASVGNDTLRSIEAIRGTDFNDIYNAAGFGSSSTNAGSFGTFNQFEGMGGNDAITGNNFTTVEYTNALAGVTVDIAAGTAHSTSAGDAAGVGFDTFTGVNGVRGSEYDDFLYGSNNPSGTVENFTGGGGDDTIDGRGGFDRAIYSSTIGDRGAGGITVNLALGTVVGNDALSSAAVGSDILKSIEGVRGTNFNDTYNAVGFGGTSTNAGSFGTFNEFEGMGGDDIITGNGSTKIAFYNALAGVTVNLATGLAQDSADYAAATTFDLAAIGKDTIALNTVNAVAGSAFADGITGNNAANILTGGGGNDTIDGSGGTDLAVFSGPMAAYTISLDTPVAGQIQVTDSVAGRDGTDTLSNVEALQFANGTVLVASGTSVSPINLAALTQGIALNPVTTLTGNADDFVLVNSGMNGLPIDLGAGTGDTVLLAAPGFYSLNLANVENVQGTSGDDTVNLQNNANGLAVDLGAGNNTINLARGNNTLAAVNVQNINGTDFVGVPSNDTLTLLNHVDGVSINLAQGANTLNLAAGNNTLANAFGVQTINGSALDDSLTLANAFNVTVNLGDGVDTLTVTAGTGLFPTVSLVGVENLVGTSDNNFITVMNNVHGLSVDLGAGNDTLMLANGSNSVSVTNVETISASDFAGGPPSDDTLTLLNDVTGVSVNLAGGTNTLNLHTGSNSLTSVFDVQSIHGSDSSDTLTLGQANGTTINLGAGNDTLNLGPNTFGVTFVYADNDGADAVSGFNNFNGDKIDLTGVASVHSLADVQNIATQNGADTIITFGLANTLTLTGVSLANLNDSDFLFAGTDTPVITAASLTVSEGGTVLITPASIGVTDPDSSSFTFTVTNVSHGSFQTTTDGVTWVNATTFTTADLTANHVQFVHDGGEAAPTFSIQADDGAAINNLSNIFVGSVLFTNVNDAPVITAASLTVSEGGTAPVTPASIGVTDPDSSSFTFTVTNVSHGTFQTTTDGLNWVDATTFTTADLTANHVQFVHDGGEAAPTFSIQADDGAAINNLSNIFAGSVLFTNVNDAPVITAASLTVSDGGTAPITPASIGVTDPDSSSFTFTVTNVSHGTFQTTTDGLNWVNATTFTTADLTANHVQFVHDGGEAAPTFSIQANDGAAINNLSNTFAGSVLFTNVNDAPVVTAANPSLTPITEDQTNDTGQTVSSIVGSSITDPDSGALQGIAITGATSTNGAWQFSTNGGSSWTNFASYSTSSALLLTGADKVRFVPDGQNGSSDTFTYAAWDQTSGSHGTTANVTTAGGTTAFSIASDTAHLTVTPVNDAPTLDVAFVSMAAFNEDTTPSQATVSQLFSSHFRDVDTGGSLAGLAVYLGAGPNSATVGGWEYSVDSGATWHAIGPFGQSNTYLILDPNALLHFVPVADFNGSVSLNTAVIDNSYSGAFTTNGGQITVVSPLLGGTSAFADLHPITVNINPVNDAPVVNAQGGTLAYTENQVAAAIDALLTVTDVDSASLTGATVSITGNFQSGQDVLGFVDQNGITGSYVASTGVLTLSGTSSVANYQAALRSVTYFNSSDNPSGSTRTVSYAVDDGAALNHASNIATVQVTVTPVNDAPLASPVTLAGGTENTVYTIDAAALLAGVTDPDGPSLSITSVSVASGSGGTIVNNNDGTWSYTPASNYSGPVGFNYTASDGLLSSSSTASLILAPPGIINGTPGPDVLLGTSQADAIFGLGGNDLIKGFAGNDLIDGGTGRDVADYSDATGGISVDMASGSVIGDASVGTDTLRSIESVRGTDFADTYVATGFNQTSPNNAQDIQIQSGINNTFEGGGGDDIITGSSGTQASYSTGNGGTQISYAHALDGVTVDLRAGTAHGTAAGDIAHVGTDTFTQVNGVVGSDFNDILSGTDSEAHVDVFYGGKGDDTIDGRNGYDFVSYYSFFNPSVVTGGISVNLATGDVIGDASVGHDTLRSIELVRGTQYNDTYTAVGYGAPGALNVSDTGTFNQFEGMGGNDTITGNGNTRVDYNFALASVTVDLQLGTGHSTVADDADVGIDTILTGVNAVRGSSFNDFLYGSANNENFLGGYGDDLIDGRGGFDRAVYHTSADDAVTSGITVNLAAGTVDGDASVGHDTLKSIEAVQGTGFADTYVATNFGAAGFLNTVTNNVGNFGTFNEFEGGGGNDTITGNGNTRIAFYNAAAGVTVDLVAGTSFSTLPNDLAGIGVDTFTGVVDVTGSGFDDTITGNASSNILRGGNGNDTIDGGGGTDLAVFSGQQSAYTITFDSPSPGQIRLADSVAGRDGIDTLTNIEALEFSDRTVLVASGTIGTPINLAALASGIFLNPVSTLTGSANDFVLVNPNINGLSIDLGAGTGDTVSLAGSGSYNLNLFNVENVVGSSGDDFVSLQNHANGLAIDLGAGNNALNLLNGSNSVSVTNVQNINGTDFSGPASNDTLTLLNDVNGVTINLGQGTNILNLAAGSNTLTNAFGVQTINGSASDDTLTFVNNTFNVTIDLGNGANTLNLAAGVNSLGNVFNVGSINGTSSADALTLAGQVGNLTGVTRIDLGSGNDTLNLGAQSFGVTFVYADNDGADVVSGFNDLNGDKIDVGGVSGIFTFADIQSRATLSGGNTVIDFGGGNTLTLNGVTSLQQSDFVFRSPDDRSIFAVKGGSVTLTNADLDAGDTGTAPASVVYTITGLSHGFLQKNNGTTTQALAIGDHFSLDDIERGFISFVTSDASYVGQGGFAVSVAVGGVPTGSAFVGASIFDAQITVQPEPPLAGYDFNQDDPAGKMGSGTIAPGYSDSTFTIVNAAANREFIFVGTGFNTDGSAHPYSSGTITSILEKTYDTQTPLALLELNVAAATWYSAVVAKANGDQSQLEALTHSWVMNFVGDAGADAFDSGNANDLFTGNGGNDTFIGEFGYDRAAYGHATGPIDVELAAGTVTDIGTNPTGIGLDTLLSIELVTGSNAADIFNATGFSATSTNAGSTVTSNTLGLFNEFEGRGGNDQITGNGTTRISYYHATAGVTVTFDSNSWNPAFNPNGGASGTASGDQSVGTDHFTGVYSVRGSFFADTFTGSNNPFNTSENFEGLGGNDTINGGGGFDRAVYNNSFQGSGIDVELADGTVTPIVDPAHNIDIGNDTLRSVEGIWGTNFADVYNAGTTALNPGGFSTTSTNAGSSPISATNPGASNFNEFEGGGGDDTVIGNGNTRVAFYHATAGVVVTLGANGSGTADGDASVGHDTFIGNALGGVSRVRGSEFNDIITGNISNNTLEGQGGNDVLSGLAGNDVLTGGTGADIFVYNSGGGNDRITDFNRSEGDRIDLRLAGIAGIGNLTFVAGTFDSATNIFTPVAGGADTRITGFGAGNTITLQGVASTSFVASDFMFAQPGGSIAVTVQTPDGYDFSTLYDDMAASSLATSADTADHIFAVDAAKGITFEMIGTGFTYDPTSHLPLTGTITEIDILDTADPTQTTQDHVLVNTNGWNISASAFFGDIGQYKSSDPSTHASGLALLNGIFNAATYSAVGSAGSSDNNSGPHDGADVFFGGDHPDVFNGMAGPFGPNDPGNDTVDYSHAASNPTGLTGVTASLSSPASNTGAAAGDIYISIENLRGTNFEDILTGDGNNNVLEGGLGHNTLNGGGGGSDTVSYEHSTVTSGVTVDLTTGTEQTVAAGMFDTLFNIQNVRGSSFNDTLTGNGSSVLEGGPGNDNLNGQPGQNDTASYEHAASAVTVNLSITGQQDTHGAGLDTLNNIANLTGSQFNDTLIGDTHNNTLFGNGGNDAFVFNTAAPGGIGQDTIGDFMSGQDHIQLDYAAFNPSDANSFSTWLASHVTTVNNGSDLLIDLHLNNLSGHDTILLKNASFGGLHANDFILPA
jgi:Ca2+-binding RTX toxin-like protein